VQWTFSSSNTNMEDLAVEMLVGILELLEARNLALCSLVCRRWYIISSDGKLWRRHYQNQFGHIDFSSVPSRILRLALKTITPSPLTPPPLTASSSFSSLSKSGSLSSSSFGVSTDAEMIGEIAQRRRLQEPLMYWATAQYWPSLPEGVCTLESNFRDRDDDAFSDDWFYRLHNHRTMRYRPNKKEGKRFIDDYTYIYENENDHEWDPKELRVEQEEDDEEEEITAQEGEKQEGGHEDDTRATHKNKSLNEEQVSMIEDSFDWKSAYSRNYQQYLYWTHGQWRKSQLKASSEEPKTVKRFLVCGMKGSGKTTFLQSLADEQGDTHLKGLIVNDSPINICVVDRNEKERMVLLEIARPLGWTPSFVGQDVDCIIFVVDGTEYLSFQGGGQKEKPEDYERMMHTYKRFHGIIGERYRKGLKAIVLANKLDLVQDIRSAQGGSAEEEPIEDIVARKLRIKALFTCNWYSWASAVCEPMVAVAQTELEISAKYQPPNILPLALDHLVLEAYA
jgi:hypothetical protein